MQNELSNRIAGYTKRIYDWNRHGWVTVVLYNADRIGCYNAVPQELRPMRRPKPLTLRARVRRYLRRYGPQTTVKLSTVLLGSSENAALRRILDILRTEKCLCIVCQSQVNGHRPRNLWGVKDGNKTVCRQDDEATDGESAGHP